VTTSACPKCGADLTRDASPSGLCAACLLDTALSSDSAADVPDADESSTLVPGTTVGPFQIVGVLGKGGMATVYEAYDGRLDRAIALKVLPPEFLHAGTFARRFEKEAKVIARLEHPQIVPIHASGINDGIPWMSMRLLAGGNLGALLSTGRPHPREAIRLLRSIAGALDYAHAQGVVHLDIKPTNILLDDSSGVYVADFGLARMLDSAHGLTRTGILAGTPQYMAPEQALSNQADHRSDIYSLAIVAYEMFVGAIPFTGHSPVAVLMKHVNEPLPVPPDGLLSPAVWRAIQKGAAKDPGDRWPSAGAFAAALESPVGLSDDDRSRSRVARRSAAGATLLVVAALAWFAVREPPRDTGPVPPRPSEPPADMMHGMASAPVTRAVDTAIPAGGPTSVATAPRAVQSPSSGQLHDAPPPSVESALPLIPPGVNTGLAPPLLAQPVTPARVTPPSTEIDTSTPDAGSPARPPADVITPATRTKTVSPDYPIVARAAELEGDVLLQATVQADGTVRNVEVLRSVHKVLDEAARKAVVQYQYLPARRNGIPEAALVRITVSFRLR
jgi:serine/threonine-protein kinase